MLRTMLKSKIHRATVTQADLHYVGSVTIDADLMDAADLLEGEQVTIVDIDNGARLVTYAITGERGSGVIGINGAAAHLVHPGDLVILIAYGTMEDAEARSYQPRIVFVDADNKRDRSGHDPAFVPAMRGELVYAADGCTVAVLLAIDVRNTHTVVGLLSGSKEHAKVVQQWRIRTESEVTADELALTIDGLIGDDSERLTGAAALSTVPSVLHEVRVMLDQYWPSVPHVLIEPGVRTGIPLLVDNPKEVGRRPNRQLSGRFSQVRDRGHRGRFRIVDLRGRGVGQRRIPRRRDRARGAGVFGCRRGTLGRCCVGSSWPGPRSVVGKNTVECMQAGAVFGFAGLVDGLVGRIREDVDGFSGDLDDSRGGGHRPHRAAAAGRAAYRRPLRPAPDPARPAAGLRTQPGQPARTAEDGTLTAAERSPQGFL